MDDARKKLRVCLICIVAAAVVIGLIYYFRDMKENEDISEGTLVMQEMENVGICEKKDVCNVQGQV